MYGGIDPNTPHSLMICLYDHKLICLTSADMVKVPDLAIHLVLCFTPPVFQFSDSRFPGKSNHGELRRRGKPKLKQIHPSKKTANHKKCIHHRSPVTREKNNIRNTIFPCYDMTKDDWKRHIMQGQLHGVECNVIILMSPTNRCFADWTDRPFWRFFTLV